VRVTVYAGRRVEGAVNTHPFDALRPETVLDVVESLGVPCDGRLFALNSFENRVYLVGREDAEPLIAKFYRPDRLSDAQIFEEHAFLDQLAAEDLPVAAPIRDDAGRSLIEVDIAARLPSEDALGHSSARYRVALFPKLRGRAPELEADEHLEWLGRLIARLHQVGARDHFVHRPPLSIAGLGDAGLAAMLNGPLLPDAMKARFESSVGALLQAVRVAFERVGPLATLRLHGDLHPGNLLWNDEGPAFVDFDDSCAGPVIQDLWMLLPGDDEGRHRALAALVEGYEVFRPFDWAQAALIEPLRALRLIHYGGWLSARYDDPAFPRAFPFAAQPRFWEEHLLTLEQQAERVTQGG
jgi:Ser/Thr protein kinase RdoA (MazF antagonist)